MKYHLQLLKKYLSLNVSTEDIAQNLILKTCEIEEIQERKLAESIVIGKVESFEKHPDADKLNICQVNCGNQGHFQIVCGGENIQAGIYVPVALVGTEFEKMGLKIAKRAVRGVDSEGMICAKTELGIAEDEDQHWIWNLGLDLEIGDEDLGMQLKAKFPWLETTVLEVDNKSLTNRPDLTGHFAASIELNAIFPDANKQYGKIREYLESFQNTNILELLEQSEKKLEKQILCQSDAVNTYISLALKGINVKTSDFFTRLQLIDLGGKPVNNWIDFSNLFMNISGQPIHFFDADKVKGNIILRNANDGEEFIDLFDGKHKLENTDLVIADEEKILALAGIIGGKESGVSEETKNILVEIANFDPVKVRKSGTRLGLRTDAELRFEKNISPKYSLYVLLFFLDELKYYAKSLGNYEIGGLASFIKSDFNPLAQKSITVDWKAIQNLIFGVEMENFEAKAKKILTDLGFGVQENQVLIPLWRGPDDMNIQEDIAEEIARIWGYDSIEQQPLLAELKDQPMSQEVAIMREIEQLMVEQLHFDQIETYPWTSESLIKQFGSELDSLYQLQNPLNPEFPYLRDKISYNLLPIAQKNSKFFETFKLFDIGKVWTKSGLFEPEHLDSRYANAKIKEKLMLGALWYQKTVQNWSEDTILEAKATVETILKNLGIKGKIVFEKSDFSCFHPKKQAKILLRNGATPLEVGILATLHPLILKQNKFPETAQLSIMELNLELLKSLTHQQSYEKEYETLQDQLLWRDLSFVLEANEDFGKLIESLEKMQTIEEVRVFDLYQGENLGEGKKSISLQIKIKGDGTMTTEQINSILQDAIKKGESTGAKLRA